MTTPADRADGPAILARYHARHAVRSLVCMSPNRRLRGSRLRRR